MDSNILYLHMIKRYNHKSFSRIDTNNLIVYDGYFGASKLDASPDSIWTDPNRQPNLILIDSVGVPSRQIF